MSKSEKFKKAASWTGDKAIEVGVNLMEELLTPGGGGPWKKAERIKDEDEPANGEGDPAVDESWEPPEPDSRK